MDESITKAVEDFLAPRKLDRIAALAHAIGDLDAMVAATADKSLRNVWEDMRNDAVGDLDFIVDHYAARIVGELGGGTACYHGAYVEIMRVANGRAAEME